MQQQETVTTPIPDALTRLRSRPRLHITGAVKTTAAPATNSNSRRHLVSSLLPKRRPLHPTPETKEPETAEAHDSEGNGVYSTEQSINPLYPLIHLCRLKHLKQWFSLSACIKPAGFSVQPFHIFTLLHHLV